MKQACIVVGAGAAALAMIWRRWRRAGVAGDGAVGVVGLGVMGSQLVLNFAEKLRRPISGFDLDAKKAADTTAAGKDAGLVVNAFTSLSSFVDSLERPRRVLLLVPAGRPVEAAIDSLLPLLDKGDVIVDMGNEWFQLTESRAKRVTPKGVHYVGCGLSGGADGARHGPCLMPGGPREAWELLQPLLEVRAAGSKASCDSHGKSAADALFGRVRPPGWCRVPERRRTHSHDSRSRCCRQRQGLPMRALHRTRWCGALRQDGTQWNRVW